MMRAAARLARPEATFWRHARAIALLPFVNTVAIPAAIAVAVPGTINAPGAARLIAGMALLAAGGTLVLRSIALFVRVGKGTLAPWDPTRVLVEQDVYRYTRNPMKTGLVLVLLAEALLLGSPALLLWFALFTAANAVYIRVYEEPDLSARYGEAYRAYCARVPRWLPRLRRARQAALRGAPR